MSADVHGSNPVEDRPECLTGMTGQPRRTFANATDKGSYIDRPITAFTTVVTADTAFM